MIRARLLPPNGSFLTTTSMPACLAPAPRSGRQRPPRGGSRWPRAPARSRPGTARSPSIALTATIASAKPDVGELRGPATTSPTAQTPSAAVRWYRRPRRSPARRSRPRCPRPAALRCGAAGRPTRTMASTVDLLAVAELTTRRAVGSTACDPRPARRSHVDPPLRKERRDHVEPRRRRTRAGRCRKRLDTVTLEPRSDEQGGELTSDRAAADDGDRRREPPDPGPRPRSRTHRPSTSKPGRVRGHRTGGQDDVAPHHVRHRRPSPSTTLDRPSASSVPVPERIVTLRPFSSPGSPLKSLSTTLFLRSWLTDELERRRRAR